MSSIACVCRDIIATLCMSVEFYSCTRESPTWYRGPHKLHKINLSKGPRSTICSSSEPTHPGLSPFAFRPGALRPARVTFSISSVARPSTADGITNRVSQLYSPAAPPIDYQSLSSSLFSAFLCSFFLRGPSPPNRRRRRRRRRRRHRQSRASAVRIEGSFPMALLLDAAHAM